MTTTEITADAIELLTKDHEKVKQLFKQYKRLKKDGASAREKSLVATQICLTLTAHARIEEELFYPAVREAIDDDDLMNEAEVEHATAKAIISELETMDPTDPYYDANVTVLGEYIHHHVEAEEHDMFRKAKKAHVELDTLGEQLYDRKEALLSGSGPKGKRGAPTSVDPRHKGPKE
jgi:hypothetical protein